MTNLSKRKAGYWHVEGRWERTHEPPNAVSYFSIEQIGGTLDDAKAAAQAYHNTNVVRARSPKLEWVEGVADGRPAYYAYTPSLTIRISS